MNRKKIFLPFISILMLSLFALQTGLSINDGVLDLRTTAVTDDPPKDDDDEGFFILRHKLIVSGVSSSLGEEDKEDRQQQIAQVLDRYQP